MNIKNIFEKAVYLIIIQLILIVFIIRLNILKLSDFVLITLIIVEIILGFIMILILLKLRKYRSEITKKGGEEADKLRRREVNISTKLVKLEMIVYISVLTFFVVIIPIYLFVSHTYFYSSIFNNPLGILNIIGYVLFVTGISWAGVLYDKLVSSRMYKYSLDEENEIKVEPKKKIILPIIVTIIGIILVVLSFKTYF